jgi:nucleotide-binding universal stress UspA family protein
MLEVSHRTAFTVAAPTAETRHGAPGMSLKRILVTTDFSSCSKTALPHAAALAQRFGAEILLVHVVPTSSPAEFSHLGLAVEQNWLLKGARDLLPFLREAELDSALSVELQVLNGSPVEEICKAAKESACDLIVIATHGHTGLKHFFLGSVAEQVVRHAPCPVLVVRQREHDFLIPPPESALNE